MENREIKFMAWDKEKQVILTDPLCPPGHLNILLRNDSDVYVWMQFTGLKDKNGKEVYVDFIYEDGWGILWLILDIGLYKCALCYRIKSLKTGKIFPMNSESVETFSYKGNIYENPELINKTRDI
ncbi:hypothetical protein LCGC14_1074390 [marine sediment metagenome]|uniref:YopX protein domain-containing protein n=1 Tax=marine sediment metagenome TaxID=412755 RepID=A0A0F9N4H0_9ZZZZ